MEGCCIQIQNLGRELRFGKSQGDRWDKFQLTTKYQVEKAIAYIKQYLEGSEKNRPREVSANQ